MALRLSGRSKQIIRSALNKKGDSYAIPDGVTTIGKYAFGICSGLTSVTIPESVTTIRDFAFDFCTGLTSITIPDGVTNIGYGAFNNCSSLVSVSFGENVTSIGGNAFLNCASLISVFLPNSLMTIGSTAFNGCIRLATVSFGNSITNIEAQAFHSCRQLKQIYVGTSTPPIAGYDIFSGVSTSCVLHVPVGSMQDYQMATGWQDFIFIIEEDDVFRSAQRGEDEPISIEPDAPVEAAFVYPNPASDYFCVGGIEESTIVTLLDVSGKVALQSVVAPNDPVSIAHLSQGIYVLQVGEDTVKLIKK